MPLFHDDQQAMLLDTTRAFLAERAPVSHLRELRDASDATGFSRDLWRQFADMGFTGILVDEAHGGLGLGHVEAGIVLEEIGRNLVPSPFLSTAVGAVTALNCGSSEQRERWLPRIIGGELAAALAIEEGGRHRPGHVALKAERSGNGFRLSGDKIFVVHGHIADLIIVSARTSGGEDERDGITLFAIEASDDRLSAEAERLADSSIAARLRFNGLVVDSDTVVGEIDGGWAALSHTLDAVRVGAASELLGVGGRSMEMTVAYLKERRQFDRPIGSFQALQHRAAHLYSELEVARSAVLKAQQLLDMDDGAADRAVMVAKAFAGTASALAVQEGVQMHGGIGMTDEYDIGLYMKRQRVLAEMFGDSDYHSDQLARLSGY